MERNSVWGSRSDGKRMTHEEYRKEKYDQEDDINDKEENEKDVSEVVDTGEEVQACVED